MEVTSTGSVLEALFSPVAEHSFLSMVHPDIDIALNDAERVLVESRRAEHRVDPGAAVDSETVRTEFLSDQDADDRRNTSSPRG